MEIITYCNDMEECDMSKILCAECKKYVDYTVNNVKITEEIKGVLVAVIGSEAHCVECGNEIYVGEIEDRNIDLIDMKYRMIVKSSTII